MSNILVIDDDTFITEFLHRFLSNEGHTVTLMHTYEDARVALRAGYLYDVLFADRELEKNNPSKNIEILFSESGIHIPKKVVLITGSGTREQLLQDPAYGPLVKKYKNLLTKPFTIDDLRYVLKKGCEHKVEPIAVE